MCVWGGKLETYHLPQGSGEEAFLWEGSEQLGGQFRGCSRSEGVEMGAFPCKADQQQLGRPEWGGMGGGRGGGRGENKQRLRVERGLQCRSALRGTFPRHSQWFQAFCPSELPVQIYLPSFQQPSRGLSFFSRNLCM